MAFPPDTTYATKDQLKARINIAPATTDFDTIAQSLLNAAASEVDRQTRGALQDGAGGRLEAWSQSASLTRTYYDRLDGLIPLDDTLTVTAVTRGTQVLTSDYYDLEPLNERPYTRLVLHRDAPGVPRTAWQGRAYPRAWSGSAVGLVTVVGTLGACTAANRDPLIGEVTLDLAARAWERLGKTTPQTELLLIDAIQSAYQNLDGQVRRRLQLLRRDRAFAFA